jgi:hypothetical protein
MSRAWARAGIGLLALLLALPAASAGFSSTEDEGPPSAYGTVDGVTYYMAAGLVNGSALTHDAGAGERRLDFQGCAYLQFRPSYGRGRLAVDGLLDAAVPVKLEMSEFDPPTGSVRTNVTLDAAHDAALPAGAKARAELAASGFAQMHAGIVLDELTGAPAYGNFTDPRSGAEEMEASVFATTDGVRDAAGALQDKAGKDDEIHVVVASPADAQAKSDVLSFGPPAALPDGSAMPSSEHSAVYTFRDTRYGGVAKVTVSSTSKAPPGSNEITVAVYAPDGFEAGNVTVSSSLLGPGQGSFEVPLDRIGDYAVLAHGRLLAGNYRIDVELVPPPAFKLDFWWESYERGDASRSANSQCLKDLGLRAQVLSGAVLRHKPPGFPMELVVLATAVAATTGLFVVKLGYETFSSAEFKRSFKK